MFGIDIIDASLLPAMFVALLAGFISFISPCVLPIVPPYMAYMSGVSLAEMRGNPQAGGTATLAPTRVLMPAICFVLGMSVVFLILGYTAATLGTFFTENRRLFNYIAGGVVIVFGLHFLHVIRIPFLDMEARIDVGDRGGSSLGAFVLGLAFAFGWAPCLGPQLGAILGMAMGQGEVARGTALLGAYALGLGLPFLLVALFFPALEGTLNRMKRYMGTIERVSGALLVLIGVLIVTDGLTIIAFWLLETFPALGLLG